MREIGTDGVAITLHDNNELHLTDSGKDVIVEIWHAKIDDSQLLYQSKMSYAEMVEFVLWTLPTRTQEILRQHGVELGLVK